MIAWLFLLLAVLTVAAGFVLQHIWRDYDSKQFTIGARCILFGAIVALLALGWCLWRPDTGGMLVVLGLAGGAFGLGLLFEVARGMSPAPSMESSWGIWPLLAGAVVGLFALGWCVHGWVA